MFGALKHIFRSLATLKLLVTSECCRRTLNRKEQLRHRAVSLRQPGFLVLNIVVVVVVIIIIIIIKLVFIIAQI